MRKSTPRPQLFGPDTKHGAWKLLSLKSYVWYAVWYERGLQRKSSLSIEFGQDYQRAFAQFLESWTAPKPQTDGPADAVLVTAALAAYFETRGRKAKSNAQLASRCATLGAYFRKIKTDEITEQLCDDYAASRGSPGTARLELGTLSAALNYCVAEGIIKRRPKIHRPREPVTHQDALTRDEAAALLWSLRKRSRHYLLAALISFYTAARIQSVLDLAWSPHQDGGCVDLKRRTINFNSSGRSRTVKEKPIIKIPRKLLPHLRRARALNRPFVCMGEKGVVPCLRVFEKTFKACVRDAQLPESVSPHTLCHTRISWLVESDVDIEKIAGFTGRSPERLRETYLHLRPSSFNSIDDAI